MAKCVAQLSPILIFFAIASVTLCQESPPAGATHATTLASLLREAEANNPRIRAAREAWKAGEHVPTQVSTLPDPQFQLQQLTVGSPRPLAGYTNSDFAYIGLGVSQDLPYPGKLRLRGEIASESATVERDEYESVRRSVATSVKSAYFQLTSVAHALALLQHDGALVHQVEQAAEARYRSGLGNQHEVLEAQLQETKLLGEITEQHLEMARFQAELKELLNRSQSSPDIATAQTAEVPLPYTYEELLAAAKAGNPALAGASAMARKERLEVELARKDFYPDFSVQYMWQRTDPFRYRAYYMLTFGVRVPIYRSRKQRPRLAEAEAELSRSESEQQVQSQQIASALRVDYETVQRTADLLKIYRQGLIPQARAAFAAALTAYESNREDFQALVASALDVLRLDEEFWKYSAARETALASLEEITGLSLREGGIER